MATPIGSSSMTSSGSLSNSLSSSSSSSGSTTSSRVKIYMITSDVITSSSSSSQSSSSSASTSQDVPLISFTGGRKYLMTVAELEKNAVAKLGSMYKGTYNSYIEKMNKIAKEAGIIKPTLAVGFKFKEGAHPLGIEEQPYPITKEEWTTFKSDAETMCAEAPAVFVVDGSKYILPI